eukprot:g35209.t1
MRPQGSADHAQEGAICLTVERSQSEQWSARKVQSASQLYLYETLYICFQLKDFPTRRFLIIEERLLVIELIRNTGCLS